MSNSRQRSTPTGNVDRVKVDGADDGALQIVAPGRATSMASPSGSRSRAGGKPETRMSTSRSSAPLLRCAIYTRKSTEEGLDQEFNSLDAQREACAAFITSQVGLGWKLVPDRYDDGGISGGTMERPALKRLLHDIQSGHVDVVVVYKIDRLTRSLADFAKIVEVFDARGVSFVSVTQQFNTTTSMGRLTLNVLLSFAQFEREVTAERIRDKIAASRKKGMWMGGRVPFGYAVIDRKLVIEPYTAAIVRCMFARLLELGSVGELLADLRRRYPSGVPIRNQGSSNEAPISASSKRETDRRSKMILMRGPLTYLLTNPIYIGKVRHHGELHDGEHPPIIDQQTFDRVQEQLKLRTKRRRRTSSSLRCSHLLTGLLFDETGDRLAPTFSSKGDQRYRYYISARLKVEGRNSNSGWRLPANEIESLVLRESALILRDRKLLAGWIVTHSSNACVPQGLRLAEQLAAALPTAPSDEQQCLLAALLHRIVIAPGSIVFEFAPAAIVRLIVDAGEDEPMDDATEILHADESEPDHCDHSVHMVERVATLTRRGNGTRIVIEGSDASESDGSLVDLIARSHFLLAQLTNGENSSIKDLATTLQIHRADISRILPLAFLAPSIVEQIVEGTHPSALTPATLSRGIDIPADWLEQRSALFP
jgi:site-specific DNA recombinase